MTPKAAGSARIAGDLDGEKADGLRSVMEKAVSAIVSLFMPCSSLQMTI
jgi:hypothetical protein